MFFTITINAQKNDIVIGNIGKYGITTYMGGTIEGILQDDKLGGMYISECCGEGPYIIIDGSSITIGGVYNKSISYSTDSNTFLNIDIYTDTSQKIKLKNIHYTSNKKMTTPCINGEEDIRNRIYENFNGNLQQLIDSEINIARKSIVGYNPEYVNQFNNKKNQTNNSIQSNAKQSYPNKLKLWQNKTTFNATDFDNLFEDVMLLENNKMFSEAIILMTIYINHSKSSESLLSSKQYRAKLYYENSEFKKALSDLLVCEGLLKIVNDKMKSIKLYDDLKDCYVALGDNINSKKYEQKSNTASEERRADFVDTELPEKTNANSIKKYCVNTVKGKYEITLLDDKTYTVSYKLYDKLNKLIKTVQGKWTLRDEGVYGTAYRLTIDFTGANSNLPSMKFTCQYDGSGNLQSLIDNQDRTWNWCR